MEKDDIVSVFSSENRANLPVYPLDIYVLTDLGAAQIHGATSLPAEALELLVLMDGKATVGDLEHGAPHIPSEALRNIIRSLISGGLARAATIAETEGFDFDSFLKADAAPPEPSAGTRASADQEARGSTAQLERDGYYVSFARRAVKARVPAAGERLSAFVVEDDPVMASLVDRLLQGAGFGVSIAADANAVVERLRQTPAPDVMLLDVMLPGISGFDILQRIKSHPVLKAIPVIMLTADSKRESVVKGLVGGADGYITKPFERQVLLDGVKAVLGIED